MVELRAPKHALELPRGCPKLYREPKWPCPTPVHKQKPPLYPHPLDPIGIESCPAFCKWINTLWLLTTPECRVTAPNRLALKCRSDVKTKSGTLHLKRICAQSTAILVSSLYFSPEVLTRTRDIFFARKQAPQDCCL